MVPRRERQRVEVVPDAEAVGDRAVRVDRPERREPRPHVGQLQDLLLGVGLVRHGHRSHQDDLVDRARVG